MKSHDVARLLNQLAEILKAGPNVQLKDLRTATGDEADVSMKGVAVNLSTLASLSRLNKREWQKVIEHYRLPVPIKATDSTRDLIGRLLTYLEKNADARERLKREAASPAGEASSELVSALRFLMRDDK